VGWFGVEMVERVGFSSSFRDVAFLFSFHLFVFFLIPLFLYAGENYAPKRKFYFILTFFGAAYALLMYVPLLIHEDWVTVKLVGHSIKYKLILLHEGYVPLIVMNLIYGIFTLVPLLSASDRYIKVFGVIVVFSLAITSLYFDHAFLSVWCFFAAVLSLYILIMIIQKTKITEN